MMVKSTAQLSDYEISEIHVIRTSTRMSPSESYMLNKFN